MYVSEKIACSVSFLKITTDNIIWLKLDKTLFNTVNDILLCLTYIIPTGSSRENSVESNTYDCIIDDMLSFNTIYQNNCYYMVCGDLNSRVGNKKDFIDDDYMYQLNMMPEDEILENVINRNSKDRSVNENGKHLLNFCKSTGLRIANGRVGQDSQVGQFTCVTKKGSSVVDYIICDPALFPLFTDFKVNSPNIMSDHCSILFSLQRADNKDNSNINDKTIPISDAVPARFKYTWDNNVQTQFIDKLASDDSQCKLEQLITGLNDVSTESTLDNNLNAFYSFIDEVCDPLCKKNIGIKNNNNSKNNLKKKSKPWFDNECRQSRSEFYEDLKSFRQSDSSQNRKHLIETRKKHKETIKKKRREYGLSQTKKLETLRFKNAKDYWKLLKSAYTGGKSQPKCQINISNFEQYFKAVNNPDSGFYQPDDDVLLFNSINLDSEIQVMFDELNLPISSAEIIRACKDLKNNRSGGPDNVLNEFFKYGIDYLEPYIKPLFNKMFDIGYFPSKWTEGYIVPLFKKGDANKPENYRGITLLSTFGKLFTRILNNRLSKWAEDYHIYIEAQAGFRKNMGTNDNIFVLHGLINKFINENKKLYVCFIDFTKAFDLLVKENIFYKLMKYGVSGKILQLIKSLYLNIKSRVKFDNKLSDSFSCFLGAPQGDCMSPFMFAMYVNDLEEYLSVNNFQGVNLEMLQLLLLLYADDIVLFSETNAGLQKGLDIMLDYCKKWKLTINVGKTKVMVFRKGGRISNKVEFKYDGNLLEKVKTFSYLGITFSTGGSFKYTFERFEGQAMKAIFALKQYITNFPDISIKHTLDLFDKLIFPILNYGAPVWGFVECERLERIHTRFCKQILNVKIQTPNNFIYGELGRLPLKLQRLPCIIKYWIKITRTDDRKYIKLVYKQMLNDINTNDETTNWTSKIKNLLNTMGFGYVWLNQGVENEHMFMNIFRQRIQDIFIQNWENDLSNMSRATTYNLFKSFEFQEYLNKISIKKYRISLTKLRVSSHKLEIESGRWTKPVKTPRTERVCKLCHTLEDEFHFVIECPLYQEFRISYISKYYWSMPNIPKFIELLKTTNPKTINKLGIFIQKSFHKRINTLYT